MFETERDLLPEYEHYRDEGCDLFPSCLDCPLPRCRYDEPQGKQIRKELRNVEIARLHAGGSPIRELTERYGVSRRTIYRAIRRSDEHTDNATADIAHGQ